jgi:hypothetical protein
MNECGPKSLSLGPFLQQITQAHKATAIKCSILVILKHCIVRLL